MRKLMEKVERNQEGLKMKTLQLFHQRASKAKNSRLQNIWQARKVLLIGKTLNQGG
jgi:hypothetical protein